jgi:hypothetical protein
MRLLCLMKNLLSAFRGQCSSTNRGSSQARTSKNPNKRAILLNNQLSQGILVVRIPEQSLQVEILDNFDWRNDLFLVQGYDMICECLILFNLIVKQPISKWAKFLTNPCYTNAEPLRYHISLAFKLLPLTSKTVEESCQIKGNTKSTQRQWGQISRLGG